MKSALILVALGLTGCANCGAWTAPAGQPVQADQLRCVGFSVPFSLQGKAA